LPKAYLKIDNQRGLHAHAAAKFVKIASNYDIEVTVSKDGQTVSGISIMGLLMLAAMPGDKIVLETTRAQAIEGLKALSDLIKNNLGNCEHIS
jgi:phosphocarrier protein